MVAESDRPESIDVTPVVCTDGTRATIYRSTAFKNWPIGKVVWMGVFGTNLLFVQGFAAIGAFCWLSPKWLSIPCVVAYAAQILLGNSHNNGNLEWPWWRKNISGVMGLEYFNCGLLFEDGMVLHKDRPYVFGLHPHGVYGFGGMAFICTNRANPFYYLFPNMIDKIHGTAASIVLHIPFVREMFLVIGYLAVSRSTLEKVLKKKHSCQILIGGEAECLVAENKKDTVVLEGRKGFVRLALRYGADLVPTYTFWNTDTFNINKSFLRGFRTWLQRKFQWSIPIYWGYMGTPWPRPMPLLQAFGKPIELPQPAVIGGEVDDALVDEYHQKYVKALAELFERYKPIAGYPSTRCLEILEAPEAKKHKK